MKHAAVLFPGDYDEQSEEETTSRGYLADVVVLLGDGTRHPVFFIELVRLHQELDDRERLGQPYFAERNMIVLPKVTTDAVGRAVDALARQGFFQKLEPTS